MTKEMLILLFEFHKLYVKLVDIALEELKNYNYDDFEKRLLEILEEYDYIVCD